MSDSLWPMNCSTPGFLVLHYLLEFAQVHVHWVGDAILPSHPLLSLSAFAFNLFQQNIHMNSGLLSKLLCWFLCLLFEFTQLYFLMLYYLVHPLLFFGCSGSLLLHEAFLFFRPAVSGVWASAVVVLRLSCPTICAIFPDQGSNPCPLPWQVDSYPLDHQGSSSHPFSFLLSSTVNSKTISGWEPLHRLKVTSGC